MRRYTTHMPLSEWVNLVHWVVYLFSIFTFILLITPWRRWGAMWIVGLFFSQVVYQGCVLIDLQNYFRAQEGSATIHEPMLTAAFTSSPSMQMTLAWVIITAALLIVCYDVWVLKR